ncbi:MAG: multicopper oxidase domain-containing protein [Caldilineaceae bacterium]|nr:multicopper oxidase domain-containing protein [Caldilineaceae bacterium]
MVHAKRTLIFGLGLVLLLAVAGTVLAPSIVTGGTSQAPFPGLVGMVCTTAGPNPTFDLKTAEGYIQFPDGNSIYMWGYTLATSAFQMPGPVLCVNEGDTVTINLTNNTPGISQPVSIIFPGQTNVTAGGGTAGFLTNEAAANGGSVSYTFVASQPGTYLYESGTNQELQVHMGLYGALVVRPALGPNFAYNDPSTEFDPSREYILVMHEIDPDIHYAVSNGQAANLLARHDRYWTINGRSMPDTLNDNFVPWLPSQPYGALVYVEAVEPSLNPGAKPALIRYANAGTAIHPFHPHGNHLKAIAQDGRFLGGAANENFARSLAAGQTMDLLFQWRNVEQWSPGPNGPVPVSLPGLQNLVFKDGVTFYSGDPELGEQDELPVGVTSFNECGEFYYPWHSHALFEFQNFDEGFGGLATMVRVDPPASLGLCP